MDDNYYFSLKTRFTPDFRTEEAIYGPAFWFIFQGEKLLIDITKFDTEAICTRSPEKLGITPKFSQFLGKYGTTNCFVAEVENLTTLPPSMQFKGLRALFGTVDDDLFILAGRAMQILHWHKEHRFCGKCGTAMKNRDTELAKICPACSFVSFPRLSPAVIMSVVRGDQILLGRAPRFPPGMYSTLAGFVEPGETLEEAVKREVREEVNVRINNIKYVASQPWPFPHSIMIGFSASYVDGDIKVDDHELEDARWFSVRELPALPSKITIARLLIDNFIQSRSQRVSPR
ncbi:MAG: NAD(+) diphosphatase [Desulfobulbaceae bacterium]|nr:NAD(+) diphosphatase [Desulfobulbaceae bacterium]